MLHRAGGGPSTLSAQHMHAARDTFTSSALTSLGKARRRVKQKPRNVISWLKTARGPLLHVVVQVWDPSCTTLTYLHHLPLFRAADGAGLCEWALDCFLQNHLDQFILHLHIHPSTHLVLLESRTTRRVFHWQNGLMVTPGKVDKDGLLGTAASATSTAASVHSCVNFD